MVEATPRPRRRPHAAPFLMPLIFVLAAGIGVFWLGSWARTTVVIVMRHAEPATDPSGDPALSPSGEARVASLGAYLEGVLAGGKVDYLYAGDTRRAEQTAAPIANQFQLPVNLLAPSDWDGLASRIKREHRGKTVVVVGYVSTIPGLVNRLGATNVAVADNEFDPIFVVVMPSPGSARVFRLRFGPAAPVAGQPKK